MINVIERVTFTTISTILLEANSPSLHKSIAF